MTPKEKASTKYYKGVGRRKTAIASVRLTSNSKEVLINGKKATLSDDILSPLVVTGNADTFGVSAKTIGGGKESQREAIRLGIARALVNFNSELKPSLKKADLLTRDPREKERKKPGLKRARRAPQWSKR